MSKYSSLLNALVRSSTLLYTGFRWLARSRKNRKRAILVAITGLLVGILAGEWLLEPRHLPWRALDIDERAGFATGFKLRIIEAGPSSWCRELLTNSEFLQARLLEPLDDTGKCGWSEAYDLEGSGVVTLTGKSTYPMQCNLTAGAHIWIRSIDKRAQEILGSGLARIHHVGTYSCRRMYNRSAGKLSKHSFAQAWDVTGFELKDGRVISVLKHWGNGGLNQHFLAAVHKDACRVFNVTLGPDYNDAHRDHFHVDVGGGVVCR